MTERKKSAAIAAGILGVATALYVAIPGYDTRGAVYPELAPNPAIQSGKVIVWADHRSGRIRRTFAGAMGTPTPDPVPGPDVIGHCSSNLLGTFSPNGLYLCPEGSTMWVWSDWLFVGPPPLVPCTEALAHVSMNGYACVEGAAGGTYWRGVTRR